MKSTIGEYAFVFGVVIAVIMGFIGAEPNLQMFLVILGILVGLINITGKDRKEFLLVAVALVLFSYIGNTAAIFSTVAIVGTGIATIFESILVFIVPAATIVALVDILALAMLDGKDAKAAQAPVLKKKR